MTRRFDSTSGDDDTAPGTSSLDRRTLLRAGAVASAGALAGCTEWLLASESRNPPLVENRPDAVYYPTHVEGMAMVGAVDAGPYRVMLSYSFPHRFWLVTGDRRRKVSVADGDSAHLMATVRDRETGQVLPTGNVGVEAARGGETVAQRSLWAMLSQNMGVHAGDNVSLAGEGEYDVTVSVGPVGARTTGAFEGRFAESATANTTLSFEQATLDELSFRRLPARQGQRGAVQPMEMGMAPGRAPAESEFPGRVLGTAESGDARLLVAALDSPPAGVEGAGPYLAVSARTPHNRYPLPMMALTARLGAGSDAVERELASTVDDGLGYHYGATVPGTDVDTLEIAVDAPPQVARHEGYETAFLDMPTATLDL
jgi:hypothetical protein